MVCVLVEFVNRQKYAVACPVNAHEGIVIEVSMTVMFCVCCEVDTVADPIGMPELSNRVMLNCVH